MNTITTNPKILGGTPVFSGTLVPVKNLFDYLEVGESIEEFLADFPSVTKKQVLTVLGFSQQILYASTQLHVQPAY
jgi:uncharacterized protein (DUF433 family)